MLKAVSAVVVLALGCLLVFAAGESDDFRFVILGDRTGGAQPGVFEEALRESAALHPNFITTVGDEIEGENDTHADSEWQSVLASIRTSAARVPVFFTPGNHDVWSKGSAQAFEHYTKHPLHYGFDYGQAHFAVLDNSRTEQFSGDELTFLEKDLAEHSRQPLKFVLSHRPSWIMQALLGERGSIYQKLAEKYQVQYFIAGHIHQMLYFHVKSVNYLCMPSAGGHLRDNRRYESGWFYATTEVAVRGSEAHFTIHELSSPFGQSRVSEPGEWGAAGLVSKGRSDSHAGP